MINSKLKARSSKLILIPLVAIYLVMWVGGIASYAFRGGPSRSEAWAAAFFLLLAGLIIIAATDRRDLAGLVVASLVGLAAEFAGVRYGFLFGDYVYTDALRPHLFGVPLVMASAWMVLFAYIKQMMLYLRLPGWFDLAAASLWMTAIDLIIDPLAAGPLGYWRWLDAGSYYGVPARNFLGWFLVSLLIFGIVKKMMRGVWRFNSVARFTGASVLLFFTIIALAERLLLAGIIGAILCLVDLIVSRRGLAISE
jgi:putative membrane protein